MKTVTATTFLANHPTRVKALDVYLAAKTILGKQDGPKKMTINGIARKAGVSRVTSKNTLAWLVQLGILKHHPSQPPSNDNFYSLGKNTIEIEEPKAPQPEKTVLERIILNPHAQKPTAAQPSWMIPETYTEEEFDALMRSRGMQLDDSEEDVS